MLEPFTRKGVFLLESGAHRYSVMVPAFMADPAHFSYDHNEKDRFVSMEANLKRGDILFDIGAELGWMSSIFATFVGPENVCLFESVPELWPNLKSIWEANSLGIPRSTCRAFVSRKTTEPIIFQSSWPPESGALPVEDLSRWSAIHANPQSPLIRIDDFVERTGIVPSALTIDIEGAEMWALEGSSEILRRYRPFAWVSIHPKLRLAKFGTDKDTLLAF